MESNPLPRDLESRERIQREAGLSLLHDLSNWLQLLRGHLSLQAADEAAQRPPVPARTRALEQAAESCGVLQGRLAALLRGELAPASHLLRQPVELGRLLEAERLHLDALREVRGERGRDIRATVELEGELWVRADPHAVHNILSNLLLNAWDALGERGHIRLALRAEGDVAVASVSDDGPGMAEEVLVRATERAFTTKGAGGSGLGLHNARRLAEVMGGSLRLHSAPGEGCTAELRLPLAAPPEAQPEPEPGTGRVLLVEDNSELRELLAEMLQMIGRQSAAVGRLEDAAELLGREPVSVVVLDEHLPDGKGSEFALRVRQEWPHVAILRLVGDSGPVAGPHDASAVKPVSLGQFRALLDEATARHGA